MAAPNILQVSSITGKSDVLTVNSTPTAITTNSVASDKVFKVSNLTVANINTSNNLAIINVDLFRDSTPYYLARNVAVAANSSLVIISRNNTLYLEEGDSLRCSSTTDNNLTAISSYEIVDDA